MAIEEIITTGSSAIERIGKSERAMILTLVVIFLVSIGFLIWFNGAQTSNIVERFNVSIERNTDALNRNTVVMSELKESIRD